MVVMGCEDSSRVGLGTISILEVGNSPEQKLDNKIVPGTWSESQKPTFTSILVTKESSFLISYNFVGIVNNSLLVSFTFIDSSINTNHQFTDLHYLNPYKITVTPIGGLLLAESTDSIQQVAVKFKDMTTNKYSIGIIQVNPIPSTDKISPWLKLDNELIPNDNFVVRVSGVRRSLKKNDILVLFNNKIYVWN